MTAVHPYLNFAGNTEEAFTFYRSVFGGEFTKVTRFRDMGGGSMGIADDELDKIANIGLRIGSDTVLMATDHLDSFPREFRPGNNVYITLEPDSKPEAERLFAALSDGGTVEMDLQPTEWAELYASFVDRFGVQWMVNFTGTVQFPASDGA